MKTTASGEVQGNIFMHPVKVVFPKRSLINCSGKDGIQTKLLAFLNKKGTVPMMSRSCGVCEGSVSLWWRPLRRLWWE